MKCSMAKDLVYYILFENYDQGMALHDLLDQSGIDHRIASTPRQVKGSKPCGMSILVFPEALESVRKTIREHQALYLDIIPLENQLKSRRDVYC